MSNTPLNNNKSEDTIEETNLNTETGAPAIVDPAVATNNTGAQQNP